MADEADKWEALLPPLPSPSLPPGSWYIDALGKHRLNCNDYQMRKAGTLRQVQLPKGNTANRRMLTVLRSEILLGLRSD